MGFSALGNVSSTGMMWWTAICLFVCAIGLVAFGVFDPKPYPLNKMNERTFTIPADPHIEWQNELQNDILTTPFSRRVTFQLPTEPEIAVGIALGASGVFENDERLFIISATNSGFVQIVHGNEVILPEQTWPLASFEPYIRPGEAAEFWVDVDENGMIVRINREILWRGRVNDVEDVWARWGLFGDGFGREVSVWVSAP